MVSNLFWKYKSQNKTLHNSINQIGKNKAIKKTDALMKFKKLTSNIVSADSKIAEVGGKFMATTASALRFWRVSGG